jgi:hypothetical protein
VARVVISAFPRRRRAATLAVLMVVLGIVGCSDPHAPRTRVRTGLSQTNPHGPGMATSAAVSERVASVPLARVTSVVTRECQQTADAVGYAVPCPTLLPVGMTATPPLPKCSFAIIAEADSPACPGDPQVQRWIFGTSQVNKPGSGKATFQHLVLWAAPQVETNPARAVDGPAVYPERVLPRGHVLVDGIIRRWYLVPLGNPSAFRGHLVLIWTALGHTYVYGYHVSDTIAMARALDLDLVRHLKIVEPRRARG